MFWIHLCFLVQRVQQVPRLPSLNFSTATMKSVKSLIERLRKKWALRHASRSADRLMQESLIQLSAIALLLLRSPAANFQMI